MKSTQCKTAPILFTTAVENANLVPLLKLKHPYFTHRGTWQCPSREAAEHYFVLSIYERSVAKTFQLNLNVKH